MNLILFGPPGAGKGTQAERLCSRLGLSHLASGDILRAERTRGTALGTRVAQCMDTGRLVPDEIIIEVILSRLADTDGDWLLDGFPRTVAQAERLNEALAQATGGVDAVIELRVADDVILRRMSGRRICPKCNRVYHTESNRPREVGQCDDDGAALVQRPDDAAEVVTARLRAYHEVSEPLAAYYRRRGVLRSVDGAGAVDRVAEAVFAAVEEVVSGKEGRG